MKKAAILARVSTEEQKKGKTIESQITELRDYAENTDVEVVDEYIEEGWSGSLLERPELDRLRSDCKEGKFDTVLILHPDRLSRKQIHQLLLLDEFENRGIEYHFVKVPEYSNQSEAGKVINRSVWSMVSELERLRIKERTRRGRMNKARKGLIVGSRAPYGYKYIKKDEETGEEGRYEINPEEAPVVKKIFKWAKKGFSERDIIKKLAELKIPRRHPPKDPDKPEWAWARSTIHKILNNETYTGITYYNKYEAVEPENPTSEKKYKKTPKSSRRLRPKEEWIPIELSPELQLVDEATFDFVQQQLEANSTYSSRNTKAQYLLRGLITCEECGSPYYADSSHGKHIYRCSNRRRRFPLSKTCSGGSVSATIAEPTVWNAVKDVINDPDLVLEQAELFDVRADVDEKRTEKETLLERIEGEEERLLKAYREGAIEIDQLEPQMDQIKTRKEALEEHKEQLEAPSMRLAKKGAKWLCERVAEQLERLEFEQKQRFLRLLIDDIVIGDDQLLIKGVLPVYESPPTECEIAPTTF